MQSSSVLLENLQTKQSSYTDLMQSVLRSNPLTQISGGKVMAEALG